MTKIKTNIQALATTAEEALLHYRAAMDNDLLIQSAWHKEQDGRHLACGLGVLGPDVYSTEDCPAQIMPRWLAQMVPWMFSKQPFEDAKAWGLKFYSAVARLKGNIPFSVVYDWRAHYGMELRIEAAKKRKHDPAPHLELQDHFRRALIGNRAAPDVWKEKLKKSYAYADVPADGYVDAYADAFALTFAHPDVDAYADAYARVDVFADADADAFAHAYVFSLKVKKSEAIKRLADGLIECLARVPTPEA